MGRSFFTGTDAQLYTGSAAFSTKITATPTVYGLVAAQASSYASKNAAYATAYVAALDPETRTKGAVAGKNNAAVILRAAASDLAKIISGTPTVTDQQKIDLGISVRATPAPVDPPGTPNKFKVTLPGNGAIDLSWACKNPKGSVGTLYQVFRRIDGEAEFTYLGGCGGRKFTDTTLPAGSKNVTYQIQAVRTTAVGAWAQFNVNFGMTSGGMTAKVSDAAPVKIAA